MICFPENSQKMYKMLTATEMADISAASVVTRTSLVKSAKARSLFFSLYICVRSIGRSESLEINEFLVSKETVVLQAIS